MLAFPSTLSPGEALKALGIDERDEDLLVFLVDPTEGEGSAGKSPRLLSSKPI